MATKTATSKTRKPKANNFVLILEQFLEKHNLTADSTPEQLSKHAPELDTLLPADDWMARRCVKVALAKGTKKRSVFSKERIEALLPDKRKGKLTIEERAKYCAKTGDFIDIVANHWKLGPKSNDENEIVAGVARQSTFRVKSAEGGVDTEIIDTFAKDKDRIQESNKIQRKRTKKRMAKAQRIPKHFSLANVSKRIQNMDVSKIPTREDLADVIVMLSMRPSEVTFLQIKRYEPDEPLGIDLPNIPAWYKEGYSWYCTGGTRSAWPFNEFLKQEPYRSIPRELRRYGKRHASRIYGGKNATPEELKRLSKSH
ncbi:16481_t:CDS:2 [Acaulospora colombiana]|uniref:16481_t:CDS:1 n=1 Tax=Acaulospora colombiana TaxID=27376 RepID=A0ACA9KNV6_9GLOM|nr:16481_t:CDS:2 [Acaulospora colombiana]